MQGFFFALSLFIVGEMFNNAPGKLGPGCSRMDVALSDRLSGRWLEVIDGRISLWCLLDDFLLLDVLPRIQCSTFKLGNINGRVHAIKSLSYCSLSRLHRFEDCHSTGPKNWLFNSDINTVETKLYFSDHCGWFWYIHGKNPRIRQNPICAHQHVEHDFPSTIINHQHLFFPSQNQTHPYKKGCNMSNDCTEKTLWSTKTNRFQ